MNKTITERRAEGKCKNKKCINCDKCFIHPQLGIACGKEYPATFNDIVCQEQDLDGDGWWW